MLSPRSQSGLEARGHSFGLGLSLKALALALASNIWPQPGLGLQQMNQRRTSLIANYRTSHNAMAMFHNAAPEQLHHCIPVVNNESFNPTATLSHLDKLSLNYIYTAAARL